MPAKHVRAIIDAKARPDARKRLLKIISLLMKHAVETGLRDDNPARDVEAKTPAGEGFVTWTENQIEDFRVAYPIGTTPRLVFELALNTGRRRGDLARMGWQDLARLYRDLHSRRTRSVHQHGKRQGVHGGWTWERLSRVDEASGAS